MKRKTDPNLGASPVEWTKNHHDTFVANIKNESDRGMVLITAVFLEECLEFILRCHFANSKRRKKSIEPLFEGFGPLSSFSGKISLCYAFSLISDAIEHDLHTIRKIRNQFAHSVSTDGFADPKFGELIEGLHNLDSLEPESPSITKAADLCRYKYAYVCGKISGLLHASILVMNSSEVSMQEKKEIFASLGVANVE
jgi:DNA-binding MltR family transcriptional regulator